MSNSPCVGKTAVGQYPFEQYENSAYLDVDWCWCLNPFSATEYEVIGFTLTCSEETLVKRHDKRGDEGDTNFYWFHLSPYPTDIVIDTDDKTIAEIAEEMKRYIG